MTPYLSTRRRVMGGSRRGEKGFRGGRLGKEKEKEEERKKERKKKIRMKEEGLARRSDWRST